MGKKAHAATTVNVSFKGICVKLDNPPPVRNLVQLEIDLPSARLSGHAMVVHVSENLVGMEFFGRGLGQEWDDHVQSIGRTSLGPPPAGGGSASVPPPLPSIPAPPVPVTPARPVTSPVVATPAPPTGPKTGPSGSVAGAERRRAPRIPLRLELRLRTPRSIHSGYTTEVSMLSAGMLVQDIQIAMGEPVIVNLIQPGTSFSFRRDGVVKRQTPLDGGWTHLGVEFSALEAMREVLFADFMNVAFATLQGKGG